MQTIIRGKPASGYVRTYAEESYAALLAATWFSLWRIYTIYLVYEFLPQPLYCTATMHRILVIYWNTNYKLWRSRVSSKLIFASSVWHFDRADSGFDTTPWKDVYHLLKTALNLFTIRIRIAQVVSEFLWPKPYSALLFLWVRILLGFPLYLIEGNNTWQLCVTYYRVWRMLR